MTLQEILDEAEAKAPQMFKDLELDDTAHPLARYSASNYTPEYTAWRDREFKDVIIKPTIEHPGLNEDAKLHRYMDLPKFLDLFSKRRLLLPQLRFLMKGDPFECSARLDYSHWDPEQLKRKALNGRWHAPDHARKRVPFASPEERWVDHYEERVKKASREQLQQMVWFLEHSRLQRELVCSCWYGHETESDAMWKIYCDRVGVAITTSVARLKAAVKFIVPELLAKHLKFTLASVDYNDTTTCRTEPWLIKRKAFKHENEIRLYLDYPLTVSPGISLAIDPLQLIERVTITPLADKWQCEAIMSAWDALIPDRPGSRSADMVSQSTHFKAASPKWPD